MTPVWLLSLILIIPFFAGVVALIVPARLLKALALLTTLLIASVVGYLCIGFKEVLRYEISGWKSPLGINLYIDGLAIVMLLLTTVVSSAVAVYATGYFSEPKTAKRMSGFWSLFFMLWGSLNAMFMVSDIFTMYVCLELISFASVALITTAAANEALEAALKYLMTALMGSLAYLLGVALIYADTGVLDWTLIASEMVDGSAARLALSLMTVGLVTKAALFPLHFWLPGAHSIAPAPVSALLSALVIKSSYFVLLRLWVHIDGDIAQATYASHASHVLGALGAGAVIWGSFQAIIQDRIKLIVAYSTVAQIGYLFLIFPILHGAAAIGDAAGTKEAWEGSIYFALSHGVAKAAMFLVAGIILTATKADTIKQMQGAASHVPIAISVWGLAGISLIGLPPSGGFIAKWQLLTSAIRFGQWPYAVVILFGGLLASGYVFRVLWHAFLTPETPRLTNKVPWTMTAAVVALGIIIVLMGLRTTELFTFLNVGSRFLSEGLQ